MNWKEQTISVLKLTNLIISCCIVLLIYFMKCKLLNYHFFLLRRITTENVFITDRVNLELSIELSQTHFYDDSLIEHVISVFQFQKYINQH